MSFCPAYVHGCGSSAKWLLLNLIWTDLSWITVLCDVCCVEETTAGLVYCDSFLPVTQSRCGVCCVEETTASLVYCDSVLPITQSRCDVCCVEETTASLVYCDSVLPITQSRCDMCCVEETTASLVYCDSVLPITQSRCKSYFYQDERSKVQLRKHWLYERNIYQSGRKHILSSLLRVTSYSAQNKLRLTDKIEWPLIFLNHVLF